MKSFAIALCAPSGTGKTTVARALTEGRDDLIFSISATTRPARPSERPGVDYHFVSRDEFASMVEKDELLEWAQVHGELYGTPRANVEEARCEEKLLILDIDVQGARQVVDALPGSVTIFLLPPSAQVLLERLRGRGSETDSRLRQRLETAIAELEAVEAFDYVVVNERLEDAVRRIESIIDAECQRVARQAPELAELRAALREGIGGARSR